MFGNDFAVVPVLVGPLQALIAILPGLLLALGGMLISLFKPRVMLNILKVLWRQKIIVVCIALVVTAGVEYLPGLIPFSGADVTEAEEVSGTWELFRGSELRTGRAGGEDPESDTLNWAFDTETQTFYSTPTLLGNRIYISSVANIGPFNQNGDGAIYCLDADTGGIVWKQQPSGYRATFSSPSVSGKYLVVGEGLHLCKDARVFCLDIENNGEILWEYTTKSHVESSPCISGDKVYIGAGDDGYYCFKLEPDGNGKAQIVWHKGGKDYLDAEGNPLVIEIEAEGKKSKRFYAGLGLGGKTVLCLDAETGKEIWKLPAPYPVFGPPSYKDGRIYIGMGNGNFAQDAEGARAAHRLKLEGMGLSKEKIEEELKGMAPGGAVWCLDAVTGKDFWKLEVPRTVLGAAVLGSEGIYFGSRDGHMYLCSYDGKVKDKFQSNEAIVVCPALGKEHIYFVTTGGNLFSLSSDSLELAWKTSLGQGALFISSPTLARGHIYIGTDQSGLLCLGQPGAKKVSNWTGAMGGAGRAGFAEASTLPKRGKYAWRYTSKNKGGEDEELSIIAPCAAFGRNLFVPVADGKRKGLLTLALADDAKGKATEVWFFEAPLGCSLSPAVTADKVFFLDGKKGDAERFLYCLDRNTGKESWKEAISGDVVGEFVISNDGFVYVEKEKGLPVCLDFAGKVIWQGEESKAVAGPIVGAPSLHASLLSLTAESSGGKSRELITMDRANGRVLWREEQPLLTAPLIHGKTIYAGTDKGLTAFKLSDGSVLWRAETGPVDIDFSIYKKRIACINRKNELFVLNQRDGSVIKKLEGADQKNAPLLCRSGLVYQGKTDLMSYSFSTDENKRWVKSKWLGKPSAPAIMLGSKVYYATAKKGLICVKEK